jgi:hypothetical protein
VFEVVFTFFGAEGGKQLSDPAPEPGDGSLGSFAQLPLQFAEACSIGLRSGEYFGR